MKLRGVVRAFLVAIFAASTVFIEQAAGKDDVTKVREATAQFHHTSAARAAGYR